MTPLSKELLIVTSDQDDIPADDFVSFAQTHGFAVRWLPADAWGTMLSEVEAEEPRVVVLLEASRRKRTPQALRLLQQLRKAGIATYEIQYRGEQDLHRALHAFTRVMIKRRALQAAAASATKFVIAWHPDVLTPEEYATLVSAVGDLARSHGAAGIERVLTDTITVEIPAGVLT